MFARHPAIYALAIILVTTGCYRKPSYTPPDTYPVSGTLVAPAGKIPAGSLIQFIPIDGKHKPEGTIQEDGSFTLKTLFHEEWLPGGVEGEYLRAAIFVPIGLGPLGGQVIHHNQAFTIEPKENHFTVTLK